MSVCTRGSSVNTANAVHLTTPNNDGDNVTAMQSRDQWIDALVTVVSNLCLIEQCIGRYYSNQSHRVDESIALIEKGAYMIRLQAKVDDIVNQQSTGSSSPVSLVRHREFVFGRFPHGSVPRVSDSQYYKNTADGALYYCDPDTPYVADTSRCIIFDFINDIVRGIEHPDPSSMNDDEASRCMSIIGELDVYYWICEDTQTRDKWVDALQCILEAQYANDDISDSTCSSRMDSMNSGYVSRTDSPMPYITDYTNAQNTQFTRSKRLRKMPKIIKEKTARDKALLQLDMRKCIRSTYRRAVARLQTLPPQPQSHEFTDTFKGTSNSLQVLTHNRTERTTLEYKSYCPTIFARLINMWGLDISYNDRCVAWLNSVAGDAGYQDFITNSKSNAFFFYTADGRSVIKSERRDEVHTLLHMLPAYYNHVTQYVDTLICRITGLYRLRKAGNTIYFFIMQNVFAAPIDRPINVRFDIKGSRIGRNAKQSELTQAVPVLKDIEFTDGYTVNGVRHDPIILHLGEHKSRLFIDQLRVDADFLASNNIMDYSLLCGISRVNTQQPTDIPATLNKRPSLQNHYGIRKFERVIPSEMINRQRIALNRPTDQTHNTDTSTDTDMSSIHHVASQSSIALNDHLQTDVQAKPSHNNTLSTNNTTINGERSHKHDVVDNIDATQHGIANSAIRRSSQLFNEVDGGVTSAECNEIYYFGIIDILQVFNARKRLEWMSKSAIHLGDSISCIPPVPYAHRFVNTIAARVHTQCHTNT